MDLPAKRKRTLASKLTSEENAYTDLFKKRKLPDSTVNLSKDRTVEHTDDADIQQYPGQSENSTDIIADDKSDDDLPKITGRGGTANSTTSGQDLRASVEVVDDADDNDIFFRQPETDAGGEPKLDKNNKTPIEELGKC
jgi:hypothetical protein